MSRDFWIPTDNHFFLADANGKLTFCFSTHFKERWTSASLCSSSDRLSRKSSRVKFSSNSSASSLQLSQIFSLLTTTEPSSCWVNDKTSLYLNPIRWRITKGIVILPLYPRTLNNLIITRPRFLRVLLCTHRRCSRNNILRNHHRISQSELLRPQLKSAQHSRM